MDLAMDRGALTISLSKLSGMMRRGMHRRLSEAPWVAETGLRPPAFGVLMLVEQFQPVSQKKISDRLGMDPSDLVPIFDLLEQAGCIVRARDEKDRRRYSLSLTQEGRGHLRRFQAVAAEVEDDLFACLEPDERETLGCLVRRVLDHHSDTPE